MGEPESNGEAGDAPGSEELVWGEKQWRDYLKERDAEIVTFLKLYRELRHLPNAVNTIAGILGWNEPAETPQPLDDETFEDAEIIGIFTQTDTLHSLPAYIMTRALIRHAHETFFKEFITMGSGGVFIGVYWILAELFRNVEHEVTLANYATDMDDYELSVCHYKRALMALNNTIGLMNSFPLPQPAAKDVSMALFDLREILLRMLAYAHEDSGHTSRKS